MDISTKKLRFKYKVITQSLTFNSVNLHVQCTQDTESMLTDKLLTRFNKNRKLTGKQYRLSALDQFVSLNV